MTNFAFAVRTIMLLLNLGRTATLHCFEAPPGPCKAKEISSFLVTVSLLLCSRLIGFVLQVTVNAAATSRLALRTQTCCRPSASRMRKFSGCRASWLCSTVCCVCHLFSERFVVRADCQLHFLSHHRVCRRRPAVCHSGERSHLGFCQIAAGPSHNSR